MHNATLCIKPYASLSEYNTVCGLLVIEQLAYHPCAGNGIFKRKAAHDYMQETEVNHIQHENSSTHIQQDCCPPPGYLIRQLFTKKLILDLIYLVFPESSSEQASNRIDAFPTSHVILKNGVPFYCPPAVGAQCAGSEGEFPITVLKMPSRNLQDASSIAVPAAARQFHRS